MYARGILFGKMKYELGDQAIVRCPETGLEANIEFKVKGWVGGTYNAIGGHINDKNGKHLFELSGFWHGEMFIKDLSTGKKELLFDATNARETPITTRPLAEQSPRESQRLWDSTVQAIKRADQRTATDEKSKIEEEQRREAAERTEGQIWLPKLFRAVPSGDEENLDWIIDAKIDASAPPEQQVQQILAIAPIVPDQQGSSTGSTSAAPAAPAAASGDLIDFGQNPGTSAVPAQPTAPAATAMAAVPASKGAQQNASQPPSKPGDPIRRMDSMGNEEMFLDAE